MKKSQFKLITGLIILLLVFRRQNGVDSVIWDVKNQKLTVVFDPMVITSEEIIKIAASLGHDTDTIKASDEAFQSLEECCKYERKI